MESESSPMDCSSSKHSLEASNGNYLDADQVDFTTKEKYYYRSINKFYKKLPSKDIKLMMSIIDGESKISLRLFDWFVTKYSDKNVTTIKQDDDDETDRINVHISYKAQLKSFKKKYFDPFKRYKKFYYTFTIDSKKHKYLTTIGQLNFFKWSFKCNVIKYVEDNFDALSTEMLSSNKEDKDKKDKHDNSSKGSKTSKVDTLTTNKRHESKKDHVVIKKKDATITAKRVKSKLGAESKIIVSFD